MLYFRREFKPLKYDFNYRHSSVSVFVFFFRFILEKPPSFWGQLLILLIAKRVALQTKHMSFTTPNEPG